MTNTKIYITQNIFYSEGQNNSSSNIETTIESIVDKIKNPSKKILQILDELNSVTGENKDIIEKKQREIKSRLPAFFVGEVKDGVRNNKSLVSTNLMIFDFDKLDNAVEIKEKIINKLKPLVCFLSPRKNGIKMIIRINETITDEKIYKSTFDYYKAKFNEKGLNCDKTSDPCRLCFLSYDPDIYYNEDCTNFPVYKTIEEIKPVKKQYSNDLKWTDDDQVVIDLLNAIKQKGRPDYIDWKKILFALADKAGKNKAIELMQQYFTEEDSGEYEKAFRSPLTNIHFGTLFYYADINAKEYYRSKFFRERGSKSIMERSEVKQEKSTDKENIEWWYRSEKGKYVISYNNLFGFLSDRGFGKVYVRKPDKIMLVRKVDNIIYKTSSKEIKDYIKQYILDIDDKSASNDLMNIFHSPRGIISDIQMETLDTIEINNLRDTHDTSYFFYENAFVEIKDNDVKIKDYKELKKPIWSDSIIKRKIDIQENELGMYEHLDFHMFIKNINSLPIPKETTEEEKKEIEKKNIEYVRRWECAMGYMLHRYKTKAVTKAVILTDREYAEEADGRTGKSLSATCLKYIRNVVAPEGRGLKSDSPFVFQSVELDTDILFINDAEEHLDFTRFYNPVSDDWQIEKKNQGAVILPFEISPKIIITTNYAIGDSGGSSKDRKYEIGLFKYYSDNKKPEIEFGRRFFENYDDIDWLMFDYYMIHCVQEYLKHGLPIVNDNDQSTTGLKYRLGKSIYDFCVDNILESGDIQNVEMYEKYLEETGFSKNNISQSKITRSVKTYLKENDYAINDTSKIRGKQGIRYWKKHF